jgi:hypothetical protein
MPSALADNEYRPLTTAAGTSGVATGGLYVNTSQPVPFGDQGLAVNHSFTIDYTLPDYTNITWARLYEIWYSGSGVDNYGVRAVTSFNGHDFDPEELATQSGMDGHCYQINDHVTKVYSDYMIWYDVAPYITDTTVSLNLADGRVSDTSIPYVDGRLKAVELVVAYNVSGSTDLTYYWVNQGQEWFFTTGVYPYLEEDCTNFDTSAIQGRDDYTSIVLTELSTSSKDAFYYFPNDNNALDNYYPGAPYNYYNSNTWNNADGDFGNYMDTIPSVCTFKFHHSDQTGPYGAGSYQIQTATLAIKF